MRGYGSNETQPRDEHQQRVQFFRVISATAHGTAGIGKWSYKVIAVYPVMSADRDEVTWSDSSQSAISGALNLYEQANTTTEHMGIDPSTLPGTFELQPIPDDAIVPGLYISSQQFDGVFLWYPNQFDGACS